MGEPSKPEEESRGRLSYFISLFLLIIVVAIGSLLASWLLTPRA